ncbi:MAG: DEAD/DEAH box helicase [Verrucomicrobiales bacterium]|nr:DEAD/DEAH box helicase [Verrucomicrobiales bacterium]
MSLLFDSMALSEPIQRALKERNYSTPSPIQEKTIPLVLKGFDVMGCAQTGTGKTAAFALPILEHLSQNRVPSQRCAPRVLVLAPTRELASQIQDSFQGYGRYVKLRSMVIFGGVGQGPQVQGLKGGPDVVVATPGRLLDLLEQRHLTLKQLEVFVLDEADRMLDMGFVHDVKKIIAQLPSRRQSLFFSATMPPAIQELAATILKNPKRVEVTPPATTVEKIDQTLCHVAGQQKRQLLEHLLRDHREGLALVFSATKHGANRLAEQLSKQGLTAEAIHGNKSQGARERALGNFRTGRTRILVATDIAARGIDVKGIDLVINYDLPKEPESYVHRIGRTARAGAEGRAVSFCDENSHALLRQIERTIRLRIPVCSTHPFHVEPTQEMRAAKPVPATRDGRRKSDRKRPLRGEAQNKPHTLEAERPVNRRGRRRRYRRGGGGSASPAGGS